MNKPQLTMEEFRALPLDIKCERYKELSDHDRFLARLEQGCWDLRPPENEINTNVTTMEQLVELINSGFQKSP